MTPLIFDAVSRLLQPLLLFFSVFLLISGHHDPGGGFTGGLVAASAFVLHATARGAEEARRVLRVRPVTLIAVGLLVALGSGLLSLTAGGPFLASVWGSVDLWVLGTVELGSPLLFDTGVYLVVLGVTLTVVLSLAEA